MKTIEQYAIDLVAAESFAEDDTNDDLDIADADHQAACDLALDIVETIRANPDAILELVKRKAEPDELKELEELEDWAASR